MSEGWFAGGMFIALLLFIFSGYPVAFALAGTALLFIPVGIMFDFFGPALRQALPQGIFGSMENYTLLAVPYFVFMGKMLERSGLAEDLLRSMTELFGPLRGGMALSVVVVGVLLGAATGVVGATVVAMGLISLPVMLRYGYSKSMATGVIAASGTLGQIIPPSVVLIVLGDQLSVSVGDLFRGALVPGLILAGLYGVYVLGYSWLRPQAGPALPASERPADMGVLLRRTLLVMVPPLLLILLVLGSIFAGVATPTEAGAFGAVGATLLAALNRRLSWNALTSSLDGTLRLTTMVLMILVGSRAFSLVFRGFDGDLWVEDMLTSLPGGELGFLILAGLVIFVLGFFIDFFEIAFIVLPLLAPAMHYLGIDPVWFGILVAMNLQTSFLTPPFGFSLFFLKGVAPPGVSTVDIYRGVIPFIFIQLIALSLVYAFPQLVHWITP